MNNNSELDVSLGRTAKRILAPLVPRKVRNWVRSPSASAKWAWDEIKFVSAGREIVEVRPGWLLNCHPAAYRCAYFAQENDPEQIEEFNGFIKSLTPGTKLFDIGAHFGLFSLAALHYGGPRAQVVAVDPSPVAERILNIQATLNDVTDRLQVIKASVGDQTGRKPMISVGVQASGYFIAPSKDHSVSEVTQTDAITLDSLAEDRKILPTHIKIDVEGDEAAVLRGGRRLLSQQPAPTLFIELHNEIVSKSGESPMETLALLKSYDYETFTVDGFPIREETMLSRPLIRIVAKRVSANMFRNSLADPV